MTSIKNLQAKAAVVALAALTSALAISSNAEAALTLNAAGIADGFTLSTFYSDPAVNYGQLGMTTMSNGMVLGPGYARTQLARFSDSDGQTPGTANLVVGAPGTPTSAATVGGRTYVNALGGGYYQVDPNTLALTPLVLGSGVSAGYGLWGNQVTGHLEASTLDNRLVDINPLTGAVQTIASGAFWDGISVSADGTTVYAANVGGPSAFLQGFRISDGFNVLNALPGHGIDGTGVISGGAFNGFIIANNNDGTVGLIDPGTAIETTIATGGSRGDLVGPDLTNGTLFLSSYEQVYRLGIQGGSIGGGGAAPEPASWALMLAGFGALGAVLRRRRSQAALSPA